MNRGPARGQTGGSSAGLTRGELIARTVGVTLLILAVIGAALWLWRDPSILDATPQESEPAAEQALPEDPPEVPVPGGRSGDGAPPGESGAAPAVPADRQSPFRQGAETEPGGPDETAPGSPSSRPPVPPAGPTRGPVVVERVQPVYPALARQARMSGKVTLRAFVTPQGIVQNVADVKGNPVLGKAASDAVMQWRYQPALENGVPVAAWADVEINFTLK